MPRGLSTSSPYLPFKWSWYSIAVWRQAEHRVSQLGRNGRGDHYLCYPCVRLGASDLTFSDRSWSFRVCRVFRLGAVVNCRYLSIYLFICVWIQANVALISSLCMYIHNLGWTGTTLYARTKAAATMNMDMPVPGKCRSPVSDLPLCKPEAISLDYRPELC